MVGMVKEQELLEALARVQDPELQRDIVELGMVRDLRVEEGRVSFTLALTTSACPLREQMERNARLALLAVPGIQSVDIRLGEMTDAEKAFALWFQEIRYRHHSPGERHGNG